MANLRKVYNWSEDWYMLFNLDKYKIMHCGFNNPKSTFLLGGHIPGTFVEERDLRYWFVMI